MTIKEALKKLFKSKGGDLASIKGHGIADIINAMAGGGSTEIIVAPEQTCIMPDDADISNFMGVPIELADGLSMEEGSHGLIISGDDYKGNPNYSDLNVTVNGIKLEFDAENGSFSGMNGDTVYSMGPGESYLVFGAATATEPFQIVPGAYTIKITANPIGEGSSLPAVTTDDNGKVLAVVGGQWDKAEAPGGGDSKFVIEWHPAEGYLHNTYNEILNAFLVDSKPCVLRYHTSAYGYDMYVEWPVYYVGSYNNNVYTVKAYNFEEGKVSTFTCDSFNTNPSIVNESGNIY